MLCNISVILFTDNTWKSTYLHDYIEIICMLSFFCQLEGGTLHLPITDPSARAVHLSPREWTERLDAATELSNNTEAVSEELGESPQDGLHVETSKARKPVVLLDVRNGTPIFNTILGDYIALDDIV